MKLLRYELSSFTVMHGHASLTIRDGMSLGAGSKARAQIWARIA